MGKKTRIVLLSITVALAVFTFSLMWIVRPDSQNSVLDSARERQAEPLLHVSEPLETDAATLSAEEEMADRVSQILASDEEFLSAVAAAIAENISLDEYILDMVEKVYSRISEDYDAIAADIASRLDENFEENVLSLYEKYKNELVSDIILSILSEYDALTPEEKAELLGIPREDIESEVIALYNEYRDAIAADLSLETSSDIDLGAAILSFYDGRKDEIADNVIEALLAEYNALSAEEKAGLLGLPGIYSYYRDAIVNDIISDIPEGLSAEDVTQLVLDMYENYREDIIADIENALINDYSSLTEEERAALLGLPEADIEEQAVALYDEYRDVIVADIENALINDYSSLSEDERAALLGLPEADIEEQAVALYDEYRDVIVADIASELVSEPSPAETGEEVVPVETEMAETEPVETTEPETVEPETAAPEQTEISEPEIVVSVPVKTQIIAPAFDGSGVINPDAPAEEYQAARDEIRRAEIEKALQFIAE